MIASARVDLVRFEGKITAISGTASAGVITVTGSKNATRPVHPRP